MTAESIAIRIECHAKCHLLASGGHVRVMNTNLQTSPVTSDEELFRLSRDGDREAFGRIVERYQTLVCSLAYSACGNFSGSEDLAQETFVAAWRQIAELREPGKLRSWLCGIVRNLSANAARRTQFDSAMPPPLRVWKVACGCCTGIGRSTSERWVSTTTHPAAPGGCRPK